MKNLTNKQILTQLRKLEVCEEAREWAKSHGGTFAELWHDCERGDWMAWLISKYDKKAGTRRQLVGALADCAELSLKYYEAEYPDDKRVRECINTCRRYAAGKATDKELENAASAAADATASASSADAAAAAVYAAFASSSAAFASSSAASAAAVYAAFASSSAAAVSASAAAVYAAFAARGKTLKKCASIIRKHYQVDDE